MKYPQIKQLKNAKNVCLIAHNEPDADALCSMIVFKNFLSTKFKINVDIFAEYSHLPHSYDCLLDGQNLNQGKANYDWAIMMDAPKTERLGVFEPLFLNAPNKMVIDHHATNEFDHKTNIVNVVSSTCEIVFDILLEFKHKFSKADYGMLYAGIITDTNNLTVGARSEHTFALTGICVQNVESYPIYENFMLNNTKQNMNILSLAIQNAKYHENGKIIISHITKKQAEENNITQDNYTGIINRLSTINGARLVGFIYPKQGEFYVSMRGRAGFDIGSIAKQNGGGGHTGAAAYMSNLSITKAENLLLEQFKQALKQGKEQDKNLFV